MSIEETNPPAVIHSTALLCDRIIALEAQAASLVADIEYADKLLSAGKSSEALVQVREMYMRSTQPYLDCIGRLAIRKSHNTESNDRANDPTLTNGEPASTTLAPNKELLMQDEEVTLAMAAAGSQIASNLIDANCSKHMNGLGGSQTWFEWLEGAEIKNKDLAIAYANGEIDSVTAIYKAMRRELLTDASDQGQR